MSNWQYKSTHVDVDTGELIQNNEYIKKHYYKLNTNKEVTYNEKRTGGIIKYTNYWRKRPEQGELEFRTNSQRET